MLIWSDYMIKFILRLVVLYSQIPLETYQPSYGLSKDYPRRNSGTQVVPTFCHGWSRSHDQGIFYIHCHLEVIPAAGTVFQANSLLPSTENLGCEATAPTCVVQNLSPLWTRCRQGSHRCQHVAIDVVWIRRVSWRLCWRQMYGIFLIRYECTARLR